MPKPYNIFINADAVAKKIGDHYDNIRNELRTAVQNLSIQTHAKIIEMANEDLKGWQLQNFLGENGSNIRWRQASDNIWAVEIDEKVMFYDRGRPIVSMATESWLLKNGKKAKDGSVYRAIPFKKDLSAKGISAHGVSGTLNIMAKNAIQAARTEQGQKISLRTIERNRDGSPRVGILHKIPVAQPFNQRQAPNLFSRPRSAEDAKKTGLKEHEGIFKLQGLVIAQRMVGAKVKREAMTFRVVSSKHKNENRWMYPEIKAHRFLERAFQWAINEAWPQQLRELTERLKRQGQ
jgi:hypothetical protein